MNRRVTLALAFGAAFLSAPTPNVAQQLPPADTVWRYRAAADIASYRICPETELLVATKSSLIALDAGTGAPLWELTDLPSLARGLFTGRCGGATGISYRQDRIVAFDVASGRRLWDAAALPPIREIRGYMALEDQDLLLLFLRTASSERSLAAVQLSTGKPHWIRDDLFSQSPRFANRDGVSDLSEYQVLIADSDTTLLLYVTPDGPMRLDHRTGAVLWQGQGSTTTRVPALGDYAPMVVMDSVLVVPRERGLVAFDTRDGHVLWEVADLLPRHASRMYRASNGLLVRAGPSHVTLLDLWTGTPRWQSPLTVSTDGVAYEIVGDLYYVVTGDRLLVADLATGDTAGLATLQFSGDEHAGLMYATGDGLVISSRQNLFRVATSGELVYHRYFPAPGASLLEKVAGAASGSFGVFGARFGTAAFRNEYAYFLTNAPDANGRTGNSLVRVALDAGTEAGRIWFRERSPDFRPDPARDQLLVVQNKRKLVALRFPAP